MAAHGDPQNIVHSGTIMGAFLGCDCGSELELGVSTLHEYCELTNNVGSTFHPLWKISIHFNKFLFNMYLPFIHFNPFSAIVFMSHLHVIMECCHP
jgi:hypothetical protein